MGVVYRAVHGETGVECALKTVRSNATGLLDGIRREVRVLRRLRHPGVVRVLDDGIDAGIPWYAMEVLEGPTLRTWMAFGRESTAPIDPTLTLSPDEDSFEVEPGPGVTSAACLPIERLPEVVEMMRRLCDLLAFLHGEGVVHRDLKPENVFIRDDGTPVLVDFGLVSRFGGATVREDLATETLREVGTLAYMAPEQVRGEYVDARADLYALGCMLYEILTGRPPFTGSGARVFWQHLQSEPAPVSSLAPHLPRALDDLCARLLAKSPSERFGYAEDVAAVLDTLGAAPSPVGLPEHRGYLYRPALVGRSGALSALLARLPERGGPGRVTLIGGESGVGKTRLALELARSASERRIRVIRGECLPVGALGGGSDASSNAPLQPLRPALQAIGDHCRRAGPEETAAILGIRGRLLAEYEPSLEPLLADGHELEALPQVTSARQRLVRWLAETLSAFAARRPMLLMLDDLQWADDATLAFVEAVAQGAVPLDGVLLLCTWRTEHTATLASLLALPGLDDLRLGALGDDDVRALIGGMLGVDTPPEPIVDTLVRASGGNPFYVGEYLHLAVSRGALARAEGRWQAESLERLELPRSLPELLDARYEALDADARVLVEAAAVVAAEATADLLGEVAALAPDALIDATRQLLFRKILDETEPGRYHLAHGRIREGALARQSPEHLRRYHERAAAALEARSSDDWTGLAHHWREAGDDVRAWPWLWRAGRRAWRAAAPFEARRLLSAAIEIEPRLPPDARLDLAERAAMDVTYGQVLHELGELDAAIAASRSALVRLGHTVPKTRIGWMTRFAWEVGKQVLGLRATPSDDPAERHRSLLAMRAANLIERSRLILADPLGQFAAGALAMNFADRAGPTEAVAHGYTGLAAACGLLGLETPFQRLLGRGREAALRSGADGQFVALAETFVCSCLGRWDRATEVAAQGAEAARVAGDDYTGVQIELSLAVGHLQRGDLPATLALANRVRDRAAQAGYGVEETYGTLMIAGTLLDLGRYDEAMAEIDRVDALRDRVRQPAAATTSIALRASILAATGDRAGARRTLDETFARLRQERTGNPTYIVPLRRAATVALLLGDLDQARLAIKGLGRQAWLQPPGRSGLWRLRAELDRREGRPHQAIQKAGRAAELAEQMSQPLDEALARWDLGRLSAATDRGPNFERARALFQRIGAPVPPEEFPS